jgi:hypothetical protein
LIIRRSRAGRRRHRPAGSEQEPGAGQSVGGGPRPPERRSVAAPQTDLSFLAGARGSSLMHLGVGQVLRRREGRGQRCGAHRGAGGDHAGQGLLRVLVAALVVGKGQQAARGRPATPPARSSPPQGCPRWAGGNRRAPQRPAAAGGAPPGGRGPRSS